MLDEASARLVAQARQNATKPREAMSPEEARAATAGIRRIIGDGPPLRVERIEIPVRDAVLPARLYRPDTPPGALLVYFHGGGWVSGSLDEFDPLCRSLAAATGCALLAVQYRKAPKHRYPGPVDDAWDALGWAAPHRAALCGDTLPLLVGGDSAGGNLAIAVARRALAAGGPSLFAQLLVYPVADCDFERRSYRDPENQLMLTAAAMNWYWDQYAPDPAIRLDPELSPCRAEDLAGLPPAIVITAEHDVLRDEGQDLAARLDRAGVPVVHHCAEGQLHGFLMMVDLLPGATWGIGFIGQEIRRLIATIPASPAKE